MANKAIQSKQKLTLKSILLHDQNWFRFHKKYEKRIRPDIVLAIVNLLSCGNTVRGFTEYICENPNCCHTKRIAFSCKNRLCSSCGKKATAVWIQKQTQHFPEVPYQHITFTMPCEYWDLFWCNRFLLNLIGELAADCVKTIAKGHGVTPGVFLAIHTFGRDLKRHVHIHLCVTMGGLTNEGAWKTLPKFRKEIVMPLWRTKLTKLFRKYYKKENLQLSGATDQLQHNHTKFNQFLNYHYKRHWNVYCAAPENNHIRNTEYLARYIKRPAIANSRLLHYSGADVKFWYFDHKTKTKKMLAPSPFQFIRMVIQHIPDKGFRVIRYYGFLANALRGKLLPLINKALNLTAKKDGKTITFAKLLQQSFNLNPLKCILCGSNMLLTNLVFGASQPQLLQFHQPLALMKICR